MSLHNLAEGQPFGQVLTAAPHATLGDIDDVLHQLNQGQAVLNRSHSELLQCVRDAAISWDDHPSDRLVGLLPLLDGLAAIADASLPTLLPPSDWLHAFDGDMPDCRPALGIGGRVGCD